MSYSTAINIFFCVCFVFVFQFFRILKEINEKKQRIKQLESLK